jgi:hypothetical protein
VTKTTIFIDKFLVEHVEKLPILPSFWGGGNKKEVFTTFPQLAYVQMFNEDILTDGVYTMLKR